ncbi:MAG TPA: EAL domain-containing protein [Bryobacteraceae bacterium]
MALTVLLPAHAASPWRFWGKADGLSESVVFGLTADNTGRIVIKGGEVPLGVLDGYQITNIPISRAYGRLLPSSRQELWTFDTKGINIHDPSGWHSYPDKDIAEFARTSPMSRISWFTYSVFRGPEDRMDVVPFGKDTGVIMFPDRLLEWNRSTGEKRLLRIAGDTGLKRFRDIQSSRDGGLWLTGEAGLAHIGNAGSGYAWSEFPAPVHRTDLVSPIEGEGGEVFVTALRPGGQHVLLRFSRSAKGNGAKGNTAEGNDAEGSAAEGSAAWEDIYLGDTAGLKGWRGPEGKIWIQNDRKIIQLEEGVRSGDSGVDRSITGLTTAIITQPDHSFWLGTTEGVARYSPPLWRTPQEIAWADGAVSAITSDRQGRIWMLSGPFLIVNDKGVWKRFRMPSGVSEGLLTDKIEALANGDLAIRGNALANLVLFNYQSEKFRIVPNPLGKHIGWMEARREGGIWIQIFEKDGQHWNLDAFDGSRFLPGGHPEMTRLRNLKAILETRNGDIWLAETASLGRIRNGKLQLFGPKDGFSDTGVFSMVETADGKVILGGRAYVSQYDGRSFQTIHDIDVAESVCIDRDGLLWTASGSGVHRYRPGQWITNTVDDGLAAAAVRTVYADPEGRIWAGTSEGISLFHPSADRDPPVTRIIDDRNLRETPPDGKVRLAFSGLDKWKFTEPDRLLFSWRMDDAAWSDFTPAQFASFDGLHSGAHRFEVRAMDRNGNVDPKPAQYEFSVLLPWYREKQFLFLAALAVLIIAGLSRLAWRHHARLAFQSGHDPLTGLANRTVFDVNFQEAINQARAENTQAAMILLDLDRFKPINDTLGHAVGDLFLKEVSTRLKSSIRKQDTLARLGGDEFAIIMPRLSDRAEAEVTAQRLLHVLRQPYHIESFELAGSASIGVSLFPEHGRDAATLQRSADLAMYHCKAQNKDEYAVFDVDVNRLDFRSAQMAGLIREALDNDYFRLHYQPLKTSDGGLIGFEALIRLEHPTLGVIPPDDFIGIAEHTGLIVRVGNWVLREASLQMARWHVAGHGHLRINVNVSSVQLMKPNFVETVTSILQETQLDPGALTLEITETGMMRNLRETHAQMEELRAKGITIALDDFGIGYSTLSSLYSLPIDYVKIDRSFVARLVEKAAHSADVIESITALGHKFGFGIVAEGIEFPEQLTAVRSIGCDVLQGYLLGRPMPSREAESLLNSGEGLGGQLRVFGNALETNGRVAALAP